MKRYVHPRNYGGAFDIDPEQFFTRDDINEFSYLVEDEVNSRLINNAKIYVSDCYMNGPQDLTIDVDANDNSGINSSYTQFIDMRKIQKPSDLNKYKEEFVQNLVFDLNHQIEETEMM